MHILADGAAVVEPEAGIDCQSLSNRYSVGHEQCCRYELSAIICRSAVDGLKRLPAIVDVPDTCRNHDRLAVLSLFNFYTKFPLVTEPEKLALVMTECCLAGRTDERQAADLLGSAAVDAGKPVRMVWRRVITRAWVISAVIDEASHPDIP